MTVCDALTEASCESPYGFYYSLPLGMPIPRDCLPLAFLRSEVESVLNYLLDDPAVVVRDRPKEAGSS